MRTTDNDNISNSDSTPNTKAKTEDAGLSSAMHDMRSLAKSYLDHRQQSSNPATSIARQSTAVDPRLLLLPTIEPRSDRWKIAMLSMMILLGLSTSAIAVGLIMHKTSETRTQTFTAADNGTTTLPASTQEKDASPGTSIVQPDNKDYLFPVSPESSRTRPDRDKLVPPPVTQPKRSRPGLRARSRRPVSTNSEATKSWKEATDQEGLSEKEERAARPYRLSRQQVMKPMKSITGRVRSCADQNGFQGVATATLVIAPNGSVQEAAVDQGSESFRSCVATKVRTLRFPKLQHSFTTKYPYILR